MRRPAIPPLLARHVLRECGLIFTWCVFAFVGVYLLVDFFDHLETFLRHDASAGAMTRYLLFKTPLVITQVLPVAVLAGLLLGLGNLVRHRELIALRACGVSLAQIALPLLTATALLSAGALLWEEAVVPYASQRARYVELREIKKKVPKGIFSSREIWYEGEHGFYNIDHFDARHQAIYGLTVYETDGTFALTRIVEVPVATWTGERWRMPKVVEKAFPRPGEVLTRTLPPGGFVLRERPAEFTMVERDAEEFSFGALSRRIAHLRRKGIDTTEYEVDLQLKLAVPFISLVMAVIGIPLAVRNLRATSLAPAIGMSLAAGFGFWVVLALAISLGHSGALPPVAAAWGPSLTFGLLGLYYFLGAE